MKVSVIERFICWKTICGNNLPTMEIINGSACLRPHLVSKYNAWKHRTIGMRPTLTTADKLLNTVYSNVKAVAFLQFKVSDSVR